MFESHLNFICSELSLLIFLFFKLICFYFWLCWVFVVVRGLSLVVVSGGYSSLWCAGVSLWWLLLLRSLGSRHVGFSSCGPWALECRLSNCGAQALLLRCMWDLPGPGIEPLSLALAGGFLTTAPQGSPVDFSFKLFFIVINFWKLFILIY